MVVLSLNTPIIITYDAGVALTVKFNTGYDGPYMPGDLIDCSVTPSGGGTTLVAEDTRQPFPPSGEMFFNFNLSAITSESWDFTTTDTTNILVFPNVPVPICFLAGTLIRTPDGDVPVESLKEGDSVISAGTLKDRSELVPYESLCDKKIKRIVNFKVTGDLPDISRPVKFKAGSLGDNLPEQDLCVSPWHGILVDGRLTNANMLFSGDAINFDFTCVSADYYHIELEEHSVIFANGVKTESFYDQAKDRVPAVTPECLKTDL